MKRMAGTIMMACTVLIGTSVCAQDPAMVVGPVTNGGGRQPGMREGKRGPGGRDEWMSRLLNSKEVAEKLGLTEEQTTKIKDKLYKLKQEEVKVNAEIDLASMDQAKLMTTDTSTEAAIMAAVEKAGSLRTKLAKLRVQKALVLKQNLTPEQLKKIKEWVGMRMKDRADAGMQGPGAEGGKPHTKKTAPQSPPSEEIKKDGKAPTDPAEDGAGE